MLSGAILREAAHLHGVCERLDLLADEYPETRESLLRMSNTVRQTATIMEVFVATKLDGSLPM